ncbi:MAG TPA: peptidyl-prolyl cis-trans isomerase [Verrucomicrobiae bacterium]|nr:peptidyl-prolyl cis-trans isomerase [Verrucomicrobiae bacterium]
MKTTLRSTLAGLLLAVLFVGCRPNNTAPLPATSAVDVVATVGDLAIRVEELTEALAKRSRALGAGHASEELRQQVLEEVVREKVLLLKARAAGVDRDPELTRRWERMVVAKYEAAHKPDPEKQRAPSFAEVEQFYRDHSADYQRPEQIRVALIQVKGSPKAAEEKRAELRTRAEKILALAQRPDANFAELARIHSEDRATRYSGGEGGWMERGQVPLSWPHELTEATFAFETPGILPLVEAGGSFYVVKLLDRQSAGIRPLAEVRDRIVHQLKEQQRVAAEERFYAEQRASVAVEVNAAVLRAVPFSTTTVAKVPGAPPSLPAN